MKVFVFLGLLALASAISPVDLNEDKIIDYINNLDTTWKAGHNFPADMPESHKKRMMTGLLPTPENRKIRREKRVPEGWVAPESFDAREEWPDCPTIPKIQDQGNCGSCWAVAAATVMSDRACVHSGGSENFQYSMENLLACSDPITVGDCDGGYIDRAFSYWIDTGIVSGGPYNSEEGCQTYTIKPTGYAAAGLTVGEPTPECKHECRAGYDVPYDEDLRFGQDHSYIPQDEEEIKYEIMTNGPVEVGFTVYMDFQSYTSGVYKHEIPFAEGGHAVRMLGWGVEDGTPYWLCANSWNYSWGENGFFKILRGSNECGIEEDVNAGTPKPL